jgi:hypothetical protein
VIVEDNEKVKEKGECKAINGVDEQELHDRTGCMRGKDESQRLYKPNSALRGHQRCNPSES